MARNWRWNPRFDLDLAQRCLFILVTSWLTSSTILTSTMLPTFLTTFTATFVDGVAIIALIVAIAKSSIQLTPDNKSVLVTGEVNTSIEQSTYG